MIRKRGPVQWERLRGVRESLGPTQRLQSSDDLFIQLVRVATWPVRTESTRDATQLANAIWRERFAPLAPRLDGIDELVVATSVFGGPVEALVDGSGSYLIDRHAMSYVNSAALYVRLREQHAQHMLPRHRRALLLGDPPLSLAQLTDMNSKRKGRGADGEPPPEPVRLPDLKVLRAAGAGDPHAIAMLPRLNASRWEVNAISRLMPGSTVLLGPRAREDSRYALADTRRLESYDVIHIGSHIVLAASTDRNAIVLSQVGELPGRLVEDGLLHNPEIWNRLRVNADVVTLGGCSSGLMLSSALQEGPLGLGMAFIGVGAASFVGSLFSVGDHASALLLTRFYEDLTGAYPGDRGRGLAVPMRKVEALREAKRLLMEYRDARGRTPYAHPAYWAGYVLVGDPG